MSGQMATTHEGILVNEITGSGDYSATKEFLWHQQRVKQEELELQEQLEQLKARSRPNTTSSVNPSHHQKSMTGQQPQQQQQQQKRPSLQSGEMGSLNKTVSSKAMLPQVSNNPNIQRTQKKAQGNDMETIFTPVITPVVKNRISPTSSGGGGGQPRMSGESGAVELSERPRPSMMNNRPTGGGGGGPTMSNSSNRNKSDGPTGRSSVVGEMSSKTTTTTKSGSTTMTIIGTAVECTDVVSWICPTCNKPDDSVPMIGCDSCDDWYHW